MGATYRIRSGRLIDPPTRTGGRSAAGGGKGSLPANAPISGTSFDVEGPASNDTGGGATGSGSMAAGTSTGAAVGDTSGVGGCVRGCGGGGGGSMVIGRTSTNSNARRGSGRTSVATSGA